MASPVSRRKTRQPRKAVGFPMENNGSIHVSALENLLNMEDEVDEYQSSSECIPVAVPIVDPKPKDILPPYVMWNPAAETSEWYTKRAGDMKSPIRASDDSPSSKAKKSLQQVSRLTAPCGVSALPPDSVSALPISNRIKRQGLKSFEQPVSKVKRIMSETSFNHMVEIIDAVANGELGLAHHSLLSNTLTPD